jgi:hypothetical protein
MADIIIPRGMENYVAIEVVIQHIKLQLSAFFDEGKSNIPTKTDTKKFKGEVCEPSSYDFSDKLSVVCQRSEKFVTQIFEDILEGNRSVFTQLYKETLLDSLVKVLISTFSFHKYPFMLINSESTEIKLTQQCNNIIYFKPTIINNEDFETLQKTCLESPQISEKVNIYIVTLVASPTLLETILNKYRKININFVSLLLTKMFTSSQDIFALVKEEFSDSNLNKQFEEMINYCSNIK